MQDVINQFGEFKDEKDEKEFRADEIQKGLVLSRNIIIVFGFINLLFVVLDYFYLDYDNISVVLYYSLIPRIIILVFAIIVFFLLKRARNKVQAMHFTVAFVIIAYLMHEFTAMHFAPVNLVFEVLDIILLCYGLFLMPNRWVVNVCTTSLMTLVFFILVPFTVQKLYPGTKVTLIIYLLSQIAIMGLMFYRNNIQKRTNYLQRVQLETLAKTDILTKIFNRTACDMSLNQMCEIHRNFSLIMIDIDDFKQINDICGHLTGDQVIIKTAETVKTCVRHDDIVARWGGEEFIIILPHASLDKATETAERIKRHMSSVEYCSTIGKVTASFGVTAFIEGDNINSILGRVDKLMYEAKRQGKNKVVSG